jgi:hypothetical protein
MNINTVSTQLLYTTFPIWAERDNGQFSSGTGFIYNHPVDIEKNSYIPLLMTNYHVIKDAKKIFTEFVRREDGKPLIGNKIRIELNAKLFKENHDSINDLAAHPIAPIVNSLTKANFNVFYRSIDTKLIPTDEVINKLSAIEEILFIGYPSGLYDQKNSYPIVRKGITATPIWNNFDGKQKFLIDAGVYPGSSGSPVFIYNQGSYATEEGITIGTRLIFLGILSESILSTKENKPDYFLGLGSVINSKCFSGFVTSIVKKFQ